MVISNPDVMFLGNQFSDQLDLIRVPAIANTHQCSLTFLVEKASIVRLSSDFDAPGQ
jgi:hypothetical protein